MKTNYRQPELSIKGFFKRQVIRVKTKLPLIITTLLLCVSFLFTTHAGIITSYDDASLFSSDISTMNTTICDFESSAAGDVISSGSSLCGITIDYDMSGLPITVNNFHDTGSGTNYLGVDDDEFWLGDSFGVTFSQTVHAFGIHIVALLDDIFPSDIGIEIAGSKVENTLFVQEFLPDGGVVLFLGIQDPAGFTSVELFSNTSCIGCAVFAIDDITYASQSLPAPATGLIFIVVVLGIFVIRKKLTQQSHFCKKAKYISK
jgi:hypothetical protein